MSIVDNITFTPNGTAHNEAAENVRYVEGVIANTRENIRQHEQMSVNHTLVESDFSRILAENPWLNAPTHEELRAMQRMQRERASEARDQATYLNSRIPSYETELSNARLVLARTPAPTATVITQQSLIEALAPFNAKYPRLYVDERGISTVRFTLYGVKMLAMNNPYAWVNASMPFLLELPPVHVVYIPQSNDLRIMPTRGAFEHHPSGMASAPQAHPHVLGHYRPCWGDFQGPIADAMSNCDITAIATITTLFLSQADMNDPAGKHAWRWFTPALHHLSRQDWAATGFHAATPLGPTQFFATDEGKVMVCLRKAPGRPNAEEFTPDRLYSAPQPDLDIAAEDVFINAMTRSMVAAGTRPSIQTPVVDLRTPEEMQPAPAGAAITDEEEVW